jgi:F-type H+-transporting ATPase subunit gamma
VGPNAANYATLREIEGRLKSIRNIEKITKTMKIVASTKLARAQKTMTESRRYGQTSNTVFENAETKPVEGGKKDLIVVARVRIKVYAEVFTPVYRRRRGEY